MAHATGASVPLVRSCQGPLPRSWSAAMAASLRPAWLRTMLAAATMNSHGMGLRFSGMSPDGILPEIVEMPGHPWFIGVQFHPELKSKPFDPHPLFKSFISAALDQSRLV